MRYITMALIVAVLIITTGSLPGIGYKVAAESAILAVIVTEVLSFFFGRQS